MSTGKDKQQVYDEDEAKKEDMQEMEIAIASWAQRMNDLSLRLGVLVDHFERLREAMSDVKLVR